MDDQPPAQPGAVANTAKVAAFFAFVPTLLSMLPPRLGFVVCVVIITCAAIIAAVPAPSKSRLLIALYQFVRVVGLNVKYALPYMATHLVKSPSDPLPATSGTSSSSNQESSK